MLVSIIIIIIIIVIIITIIVIVISIFYLSTLAFHYNNSISIANKFYYSYNSNVVRLSYNDRREAILKKLGAAFCLFELLKANIIFYHFIQKINSFQLQLSNNLQLITVPRP